MVHTATFLGKDILGGAVNMNEIKINNPKEKNKKKGAHFYAALGICILAVGVAAYTTYDSINRFAGSDDDVITSKTQQRYKVQNNADEKDTKNASNKAKKNLDETTSKIKNQPNSDSSSPEVISTNAESSGVIVYPTSKNIVKDFSGENPVFSKTLNDWRVHKGIDLAAEQGSKIKAITNGTVKEIYNDALYGTTMVIEHDGGFCAYYSGLGETTLVNVDDKVEAGQEIASINGVPCESADGYHLHLSIKKDDKFINPAEILG